MVDENTIGREPITVVEFDQDFCDLVYGNAPCTASIGVTGDTKCYNTFPTCQDTDNYTKGTLTLRFCTKTSSFPSPSETELYLPFIESVSTSPTEININGGDENKSPLGKRASITIKMRDAPYNDARVDKYLSGRGFDPLTRSTFWVKFLARNKFYQGRALRVRDGYVGQTVSSMRTRHYIVENITGIGSNDSITITAKDELKRADDKRAQAPAANTGVLEGSITSAVGQQFFLVDESYEDYSSNGVGRIGDEIVEFQKIIDFLGSDETYINLTARGQYNTTAESHDAGESFQECLEYSSQRVDSVIQDLLTNYAGISASYITTADWTAEADTWLADFNVNTLITEPTGVNKLVGELCQQCLCFIWWDEVNQEIKFQAVRPADRTAITDITEDANIVANSVKVMKKPDQRKSRVLIYYDRKNPTENLDQISNFKVLKFDVDTDAESTNQYNESRILKIFSRWFSSANDGQAITLAARTLLSFRDDPIYVTFDVDAKDRSLDIGDVIRFNHRSFVDKEGQNADTLVQVISREEINAGHTIRYKTQIFGFLGRYAFVMPNSANDFGSATDDEKLTGGYISDNNGKMSDGSDAYKIA